MICARLDGSVSSVCQPVNLDALLSIGGDEMAEKIQIMGSTPVEEEPLYGLTYLPRKFKATFLISRYYLSDILSCSCYCFSVLDAMQLRIP